MDDKDYSEILFEMASVRPKVQNLTNILTAVNPDVNRKGDAYFKVYDSNSIDSAETVWRIYFNRPEFVKEHTGFIKASTEMKKKTKKDLINHLKLKCKENTKYTVWDALKFHWNDENGFCLDFNFDDFMNGLVDKYYIENKLVFPVSYIKYNLDMPDYIKL